MHIDHSGVRAHLGKSFLLLIFSLIYKRFESHANGFRYYFLWMHIRQKIQKGCQGLCIFCYCLKCEVCTSVPCKNSVGRPIFTPCVQAFISPACPNVGTQHSHCQLNSNQQTKMEWDIELHPISSPILKPVFASHKLAYKLRLWRWEMLSCQITTK